MSGKIKCSFCGHLNDPDNTFGKGFSWADAPWFDANGLKDIPAINKSTVLETLQEVS